MDEENNIYEVTSATIRRAYQIAVAGDREAEENGGKVVSTAIKQILMHTVHFQIGE